MLPARYDDDGIRLYLETLFRDLKFFVARTFEKAGLRRKQGMIRNLSR